MILIIDNYDSFTFNLAQMVGAMGFELVVLRNDRFTFSELDKLPLQGVIISPGPGEPRGAGLTLEAIGHFKNRLPVLGICLGHQAIGAYAGAMVVGAERLMHGKVSPVTHRGDKVFAGVSSPFTAMRYHSLILERETMPGNLEIIAETREGEIMGIRHREYENMVGLQFHPESFFTPDGKKILENYFS